MLRFIAGAIAGGMAVWIWGDELRDSLAARTRGVRAKTADALTAEGPDEWAQQQEAAVSVRG